MHGLLSFFSFFFTPTKKLTSTCIYFWHESKIIILHDKNAYTHHTKCNTNKLQVIAHTKESPLKSQAPITTLAPSPTTNTAPQAPTKPNHAQKQTKKTKKKVKKSPTSTKDGRQNTATGKPEHDTNVKNETEKSTNQKNLKSNHDNQELGDQPKPKKKKKKKVSKENYTWF